ncbi:MAG: ATPase domain-containing protein [Candidatus Heimdallarchaeaceae archaeon]
MNEITIEKEKNEVVSEVVDKGPVEITIDEEQQAKDLYNEFSSFLEQKEGITPDSGVKMTISTGIDLADAILGGGFVIGGLNIIVGQPGSGKTMLAIQTMAQGQRQYKGKLLPLFLDSEESTTTIRLANLGVKYPKVKPYTDITVERVFKIIESLCVFKIENDILETPSVVIWDSIANTLSEKERETEDVNKVIGQKARVLSMTIPQYVTKLAKNNVCLLAVNQLRDVIDMGQFSAPKDLKFMSPTKDMPGGNVLKFNAFQLVEMKIKSAIAGEKAEKYGFEGIIVKLKCVKNKLFPPNIEIELVGSFTEGFSNYWTNFEFLKTTKRLHSAAWCYLMTLPEKKFRTKDSLKLYNEDETFRNAFDASVKEALQTEVISKYGMAEDESESNSDPAEEQNIK